MLSSVHFAELMVAVIEAGGCFRFTARGNSMTPFIRDGDTLTISAVGENTLRLGDVVAFARPASETPELVIHRVVGIRGALYHIQGDGFGSDPEFVPSGRIVGRVVNVERNGRPVRLGLGAERRLVAWVTRTRLLWKLVWPLWHRLRRPPVVSGN